MTRGPEESPERPSAWTHDVPQRTGWYWVRYWSEHGKTWGSSQVLNVSRLDLRVSTPDRIWWPTRIEAPRGKLPPKPQEARRGR